MEEAKAKQSEETKPKQVVKMKPKQAEEAEVHVRYRPHAGWGSLTEALWTVAGLCRLVVGLVAGLVAGGKPAATWCLLQVPKDEASSAS